MSAERVFYLDSSAIVKLVVREPESLALRRYLRRRRPLVTSALARAEVMRATLSLGDAALRRGVEVVRRIDLVRINDRVLTAAGVLEPVELRTLDAIHLATASLFEDTLGGIISYDPRMLEAARSMGWTAVAPE
jgi:predicted nucleic acid-binding protein